MRRINRSALFGVFGFGLLLVTLLTSPWMFSFLPTVALAKSALFSVVLMFAGSLLTFLPGRLTFAVSIGSVLILACYFYAWFFFLSTFDRLGFLLRTGLSGWTTLCVVVVTLYFLRNTDRLVEAGSLAWPLLLIGCSVGLYLVLSVVPTSYLMAYGSPNATRERVISQEQRYLEQTIFPFSLPVQFGVDRYGRLLPDLPEEQIFFLLLDGLRHDYVGKTMAGVSITPTLDALSETGMRFFPVPGSVVLDETFDRQPFYRSVPGSARSPVRWRGREWVRRPRLAETTQHPRRATKKEGLQELRSRHVGTH